MVTSIGKIVPLGSERLKICEVFAEFIHLQYLFTSSPLFEMMSAPVDGEDRFTAADGLINLTNSFVDEKIMERCIVWIELSLTSENILLLPME